MNKKLINLLIVLFSFVLVSSFPFNLLTNNEFIILLLSIIAKIIYILFLFFIVNKKYDIIETKPYICKINLLLFVPTIIIVFNNLIFCLKEGFSIYFVYDNLFVIEIINVALIAIVEEIVFRYYVLNYFNKKPILKVIYSGIIFGLFHLTNFLSTFNPADLIQVIYGTGLGLVFGMIYEFTGILSASIIMHFLFNLINSTIFIRLENVTINASFYYVSLVVSMAVAVYLIIVYRTFLKEVKDK